MKLTLFKRNPNNQKIQEWTIEVLENKYRTSEGYQNGKIHVNDWVICEGKNIGKKSENTSQDQAKKEALAKVKKKTENGYTAQLQEIDNVQMYFEPMLAEKYKKFTEPVYSQPKLDGIRNVVLKEGAFTRQGKPQLSIPHVIKDLSHLFILYPDLVIDGELYNHDLKSDFNKITSVVKKQKPTKEDLEESEKLIKYYVYDVYFKNSPNMTLEERYDFIFEHLSNIKSVVLIKTTYCETLKELNEIYAEYLTEGYEGQMIRKLNSIYENKRSKNLVKRKEFIDEEFVILDINEGVGNWQGKAKTILFLNKDGSTFSTGVKGNMDYCTDLLKNKNKYLNKLATVRYQELTPDGVPRFGVMYGVRDYE